MALRRMPSAASTAGGRGSRTAACSAACRRSQAARVLLAAVAVAMLAAHAPGARAQTAAVSCLPTTGTLTALAASGGCAVTMTVNDTFTGFSPLVVGVNLGHHYPQEGSWLAYLEHLGVNGAWRRARPARHAARAARVAPHGVARRAQREPQRRCAAHGALTCVGPRCGRRAQLRHGRPGRDQQRADDAAADGC